MDGNIGLVANGAGLGLATLDLVHAAGEQPANFMDIRTTATSLDVAHSFTLLLDNPQGTCPADQCAWRRLPPYDTVPKGSASPCGAARRTLPVITSGGSNADYARSRFTNFGCRIVECPDMWTAAVKAVAADPLGFKTDHSRIKQAIEPTWTVATGEEKMAILIDRDTRVICQGMTGWAGTHHTANMMEYGTRVVGGVTPGKGGRSHLNLPVFDTVADALGETGANASMVFVPPSQAAGAIIEAIKRRCSWSSPSPNGCRCSTWCACVMPLPDPGRGWSAPIRRNPVARPVQDGRDGDRQRRQGSVGIISRSASLTSEVIAQISAAGLGQSTTVGVGGDPCMGSICAIAWSCSSPTHRPRVSC